MAKVIEHIVRITTDGEETKAEVVGEIVRCKDCKHWRRIIAHGMRGTCDQWCTLNVTMECNYCSKGERKETKDATD